MTTTATPTSLTRSADEVAEQVFTGFLGGLQTFGVYVGERLGWFDALRAGSATAPELAARTDTHPRYAREWLEMQAAFGLVEIVAGSGPGPDERRFALGAGAEEVLTDRHSLAYLGALPRMLAASGRRIDALLDAYRTGGGVGWGELGADARESQAALNRPIFETQLAPALAAVPDLDAALRRPGARIGDLGCGAAWSTLALAAAYPEATLVGYDVDAPTVAEARANVASAGRADRVAIELADADTLAPGSLDAAFLFECLHDLPRPVEVLAAVRAAVGPDGTVVVMDEAVADELAAPAGEIDRLMYGYSLLVCLPDGMSAGPSAATGTVFRRPVLEAYARAAGFRSVEVLPIEGVGAFRFYRLVG